eukprot:RCo039967
MRRNCLCCPTSGQSEVKLHHSSVTGEAFSLRFNIVHLFHFDLLANELIDICCKTGAVDIHENKRRDYFSVQIRESPSDGPGTKIMLTLMIILTISVKMAKNQNVYIKPSLPNCKAFSVSPRNNLMSVNNTNLEFTQLQD